MSCAAAQQATTVMIPFTPPLQAGTIRERKSIYLFSVDVEEQGGGGGGKKGVATCFCPAQGKMGAIRQWAGVPCLLSPAGAAKAHDRSTSFTVEAVADPSRAGEWIGINQLKYKDYVESFLRKNVLQDCLKVSPDDKLVRFASAKQSGGVDFAINDDNVGVQVRTPLIALYDTKALAQLRDEPKANAKRKAAEQTLDKWFSSTSLPLSSSSSSPSSPQPSQKKAKADAPPKAPPKTFKRMIVILCFAYDSPVLDPKAEHFPRELVANAGTDNCGN